MQHFLFGLIAGAAGTTALNVVTYLDMLVRGRPSSKMPADVAGSLAERAGMPLNDSQAEHRKEGLGALLGMAIGVVIGGIFGLIRPLFRGSPILLNAIALGGLAMAASDVPATKMGKTDP